MNEDKKTACPICKTPFQGVCTCPQCGADLSPLMKAIGRAFHLRCQARQALGQGEYRAARRLARKAQLLHHTFRGQSLLHAAAIAMAVRIDSRL